MENFSANHDEPDFNSPHPVGKAMPGNGVDDDSIPRASIDEVSSKDAAAPPVREQEAAGEDVPRDEAEEQQKQQQDEDSESNQLITTIESIHANNASFANKVVNLFISESEEGVSKREKIRNFQKQDCHPVIFAEEEEELSIYEFDEDFIAESLSTWLTRRILVLAGKPNLGKTATALRLCQKLEAIPSAPGRKQQTFIVKSLKTSVKLNISEITKDAGNFAFSTLIFGNAFAGGNLGLSDFFADLDNRQLKDITAAMEKNEMYFIFTTNTEMISACEQSLRRMNILTVHPLLSKERLQSSFRKKLDRVSAARSIEPRKISDLLDREGREFDNLFETRQITTVIEFVDTYLESILSGEIGVREAIKELEHLDNWFLNDLTKPAAETEASKESLYLNFETWCFVLALTLTQCVRETTDSFSPYEAVPWIYFERFRERITKALMEKIGISHPRKPAFGNYVSEQNWLAKGRAEIYEDADSGIDMIRFKNERYAEQLWEVLLKNARRTLFMLIPTLEELAGEINPGVRALAARMIGRIGEIDVDEITLRICREWIISEDIRQMATVGYLYEGILFSQNKNYRKTCRDFLEIMHLRFSGSPVAAASGKEKVRSGLWTAIATYKQIGKYKLSSAVSQLGKIAEFALTEQAQLEKLAARLPAKISKNLEKEFKVYIPGLTEEDSKFVRAALEKDVWTEIRETLFFLYETDPYFKVFKHTIISLCLNVSPLRVFSELHKWFDSDNAELKMFLAFSFLRQGGIAEDLTREKIQISSSANAAGGSQPPVLINPIIDEMASSENSIAKMAGFLEDIFCGFDVSASSLVQVYYRRQFFRLLKKWAQESLQSEAHEEIMISLFVALLENSFFAEIADGVNNLIKDDPDFSDENNPLYSFREKVFKKSASLRD